MFNWADFVDVDLKNVDKQDAHGLTQLYNAVCDGDVKNIKVLIRAKANPNIPNFQGYTPVFMAANGFNSSAGEIIKLLSEAGANVNTPEPKAGLTPLHLAAKCGHVTVIKALVDASASVNTLDNTGYTPLCIAVRAGHVDVVSALLEAKASLKGRPDETVSFDTVLQDAREQDTPEHREIIRLLETHLLQTAEQGNVEAQLMLGYNYLDKADKKSEVEARAWFSRAVAQHNNSLAKYQLAMMTLDGKGGPKNPKEGFRLLQESATAGDKNSIHFLKEIGAQQKDEPLNELQQKIQSLALGKNNSQPITRPQQKPKIKDATESQTETQRKKQPRKPIQPATKIEEPPIMPPRKLFCNALLMPPRKLLCNALQIKTEELNKMLSTIDQTRDQTKKLQETIVAQIKTSSDKLAQPLKDVAMNKDRHLKLEANLTDLRSVVGYDVSMKAQEKNLNNFLALLQRNQRTLADAELQKNLISADDTEKNKPIFTAEEFLVLRQALTKNESVNDDLLNCSLAVLEAKYSSFSADFDEVFSRGLSVLETKYALLFATISELNDNLIKLSGFWQTRAAEHSNFGICTKEEEQQRVLPPAKMSRIEQAVAQIKCILDKRIKTEEKTARDRVAQDSQQTSASQGSESHGSGNERGEPARRVTCIAREQDQHPVDREHQEENALLVPKKKLSKAARKKAYEEQKAAKALRTENRIEAYRQKQAARATKALQEEQACARDNKLAEILTGKEAFSASETKTVTEEKITVERQHPLFKKKTIESYNELQKLKSIIKIIKKTGGWTPERKYAILQNFAFLNDVVSAQHEHPATKEVARCLRNAIFKQCKEVMNIVQSDENLLGMANAWVKFLETPDEMRPFVNEEAVLEKVSSELLTKVYRLGTMLKKEIDITKSCDAFEELMRFGHAQRYETECSIRLILGEIRVFQNSIEKGHEIIITPAEETFIVYYKNKNNCEVVSFHCDEDQRALLLTLMFNGETLVRDSRTEEIYKQIYAAVASKEGCTRFGDDIIGCEAARFYWAITGAERGSLEQAAKEKNGRALALLKQFALQLFRPEHLERGKRARHFKVLEEETKNSHELDLPDFEPLLFARNIPSLTSFCLSAVANGHSGNLPNGQLLKNESPKREGPS